MIKYHSLLPWVLCLCLLATGFPYRASKGETLRYAVVSPTVNVRNAISQTADIVYVIKESGKFLIVSESKDSEERLWYKIKINNSIQGFIASWVVDSVTKQETETPVSGKKAVLDPGVKIRLQPSLDGEIDQIVNTTVEKVILAEIKDSENRSWYRIQLNSGKMGWVASWVVTVKSISTEKKPATDKLIILENVNIRKGPGMQYDVVAYVSSHIEARGIVEDNDKDGKVWYLIKLPNNVEGWAASWVVEVKAYSDKKETVSGKKVIIEPVVNVRKGPSTTTDIVKTITIVAEYPIVSQGSDINGKTWYEIQLDPTLRGWVASWVVKVKSSTTENEIKETANLRSGPGTNFEKIAEVKGGRTFQLVGSAYNMNKDTWYAIQIDGKNGWIFGQLVNVVNPKELDVSKIGTKITLQSLDTSAYTGPSVQFPKVTIPKKENQFTIVGVAINHEAEAWFQIKQDNSADFWILQQNQTNIPSKPAQKITALSWSKKQQGIEIALAFEEAGELEYDSFPLTNPIQMVIDIKNAVLFKKEHFELINHAGIINIRATQYSVNPHIVRIVLETTKEFQLIQRTDQKTSFFELSDSASYQGPKLVINGREIENHLSLKESKGSLYVPLYVFSNMVNGILSWDKDKNEAIMKMGLKEYRFALDAKYVLVSSSSGQQKVAINNPISVFGDVMYFPFNGLEPVFKVKTYSTGNWYYADNQLLEIVTSEEKANPVLKCSFSLPVNVQKKSTEKVTIFSFQDTALSSAFVMPSMDFIDKILSLKRTATSRSSVEVSLFRDAFPTLDTANLEEEFTYVISMKKLKSKGLGGKKIILDAGHGAFSEENYYDTGAIGPTGLLESVVNLKVALSLKEKLEKAGAVVILTRDQEQNKNALTLEQRIVMANKSGADLYISIHQNASVNQEAKGSEVYYYNEGSLDFAEKMLKSLISFTGLTSRGIKKRGFAVTKEVTTMPSILIECAFISNPEEERMLQSDKFIELITDGLLKGLQSYFE